MTKLTMNTFIYLMNFVMNSELLYQQKYIIDRLSNTIPVALVLTYLSAARGCRTEFVQVGRQRIPREEIGPAGAHALKPLEELRLVLGEVKTIHRSPLSLGHDGYPDAGWLVAGAADLLHLCYSVQHGLNSGLQTSLGIEYILARPNICDIEANYHI